jgi:hypothetical protein
MRYFAHGDNSLEFGTNPDYGGCHLSSSLPALAWIRVLPVLSGLWISTAENQRMLWESS